ncbi:hypothetical protein IR215_15450 [Simulacricoccus sp. 17bor-14]|nr:MULTISPECIES: hypothetical protein [Myxococcaceae]MBF5043785.1 hypothetical protein [Simulacricoccus sp. 17bor-14]
MRHGEGGDDLQHVPEHRAEARARRPALRVPAQHAGQQQRDEEEQVVEPLPDVEGALAHHRRELARGPAVRERHVPRALARAEHHRRSHARLARDAREAAVLRVLGEEERVLQVQRVRWARAREREQAQDLRGRSHGR